MRIGVFGRGRLGRAIAAEAGASVAFCVGREEAPAVAVDVAIDASSGAALERHLAWALHTATPFVIGTTGWTLPDLASRVADRIGVVVAPNFSLTVMLYARLAARLARFAAARADRDPYIIEHHHARKHDSPSGTAKMLARVVLENCPRKTSFTAPPADRPLREEELCVSAVRAGHTYSSHVVGIDSPGEVIEIHHAARSAAPYAQGALAAAQWIQGRKGVFHMDDVARDVLDPMFADGPAAVAGDGECR